MPATEVEATVGAFRDLVFVTDGEVPKLLLRDEVGAVLARGDIVHESPVLDFPGRRAFWGSQLPATQVLAVEQRAEAFVIRSQRGEANCDRKTNGQCAFHISSFSLRRFPAGREPI